MRAPVGAQPVGVPSLPPPGGSAQGIHGSNRPGRFVRRFDDPESLLLMRQGDAESFEPRPMEGFKVFLQPVYLQRHVDCRDLQAFKGRVHHHGTQAVLHRVPNDGIQVFLDRPNHQSSFPFRISSSFRMSVASICPGAAQGWAGSCTYVQGLPRTARQGGSKRPGFPMQKAMTSNPSSTRPKGINSRTRRQSPGSPGQGERF